MGRPRYRGHVLDLEHETVHSGRIWTMDANGILAATLRDGGATLDSWSLEPIGAGLGPWAVGGDHRPAHDFALGQDGYDDAARLAFALCHVLGSYDDDPYRPAYIGTWVDDGRLYVDAVSLHSTREDAVYAAYVRGERAIYNLATGETVSFGQERPE